ncbi:hypothetical protein HHI36_022173, partial [Cryptolaemus montrouzieri]
MAETVKKSRIVSDDDLEGTLMEEFNLRLKSCLSQDALGPEEELSKQEENFYENVTTIKSSTEIFSSKTVSQAFIETEKREQTLNESTVENGRYEISNGHSVEKVEENIYENVQSISKMSSNYVDMGRVTTEQNGSSSSVAEGIYEDIRPEEHENSNQKGDQTSPVRTKPSFTLFSAASIDASADAKSAKDRMLLSSDDTSTLLFTQTVTSPMLTPSEENVDFLKGFRRDSTPNTSPKDGSQSEESPKTNGQDDSSAGKDGIIVQDGDSEVIDEIHEEPHAERIQNQVQENIYENLETMDESIYENVDVLRKQMANDCFNKLGTSHENSACLDDSEPISEEVPEIVSQIEQHRTPDFGDEDDVTEISDACSLDKQVSDSDSSNLILENSRGDEFGYRRNSDRFGVIQDYIDNERYRENADEDVDEFEIEESRRQDELMKAQKMGYDNSEVMEYIALTEEPKNRSNLFKNEEVSPKREDDHFEPNECGDYQFSQNEDKDQDVCVQDVSPTQTRIVDEIVKNYVSTKTETNLKGREKDTETVPAKIVQNLTSQFMKNGDEKDDLSGKNKKHDANQLKSVDIMKQINKFEQKEEIQCDSTQITESYVETTTFDSNMGEKAMKKKKSKKSRKEEKENISVNDTNLDSFYNVSVKNLCRSFGDLTKIDEKCKQLNPQIRYTLDRT